MRFSLLVLLLYSCLLSHPHTFIEVYPKVKIDKEKRINITYKFDEMTSSMLIMELDANMNGKIDTNENRFIKREYFSMFKPYNYYVFIFSNNKKLPTKPENFKATIENEKLCYSFDIFYNGKLQDLYLEFGDPDLYSALVLKKHFIDAPNISTKVTNVDKDFYFVAKMEFQ